MTILALDIETVRVRWLSLSSVEAAHIVSWQCILDENEVRRAHGFHFAADRDAFIAAHALARTMLRDATGRPPADWRYVAGEFGKPQLADFCRADGLQFNISHTRALVACAIAYSDVGVDVELANRATKLVLAKDVFAPEEFFVLNSMPTECRSSLFFRFWTLKEAFIKATGEGLRRPLPSFSFDLDPARITFHPERRNSPPHQDEPDRWQFAEYCPSENAYLAVAVRCAASQEFLVDARAALPEEILSRVAMSSIANVKT